MRWRVVTESIQTAMNWYISEVKAEANIVQGKNMPEVIRNSFYYLSTVSLCLSHMWVYLLVVLGAKAFGLVSLSVK